MNSDYKEHHSLESVQKGLDRVMADMYFDSNSMNVRLTKLDSKLDSLATSEDIANFKVEFWKGFGLRAISIVLGISALTAVLVALISYFLTGTPVTLETPSVPE